MGKDNITLVARACILTPTLFLRELGCQVMGHQPFYPLYHFIKLLNCRWQGFLFAFIWHWKLFCFKGEGKSFTQQKVVLLSFQASKGQFFEFHQKEDSKALFQDKQSKEQALPRILIVEDNPLVQFIHQEMLSKLGFKVDIAATGAQALRLAHESYHLVFLDIGLPDISGIEVAHKFRVCQPNTRLIAVTAHADVKLKEACLAAGIEQVLLKPLTFAVLKNFVNPIQTSDKGPL